MKRSISPRRTFFVAVAMTLIATVAAPADAGSVASIGETTDAVTVWNANAGEAAIAACLSPDGNPLHESRMYAMTHMAIHDALNAIDRRSAPYVFDGTAGPLASPDAAVAAAARDVLVTLIGQLPDPPVPQVCRDAGIASVEADYAAALARIPDGPAKTQGLEVGCGGCRRHPRAPGGRRIGHAPAGLRVPTGRRARRVSLHARHPVRVRTGLGGRDPVRAEVQLSVPGASSVRRDQQEVHEGFQRGEASGWGRRHHAQRPHGRCRRRSRCSGSRAPRWRGTGSPGPSRRIRASTCGRTRDCSACSTWPWPTATSARSRPSTSFNFWRPVTAIQTGRHRRQPEHRCRRDLDPVGDDSSDPGPRLGAQRPGRCGGPGPAAVLRHRSDQLRELQHDAAGREHVYRRVAGDAFVHAASPRRRRRTGSRASSWGSTSATRSSKGSNTARGSAIAPSTCSCSRWTRSTRARPSGRGSTIDPSGTGGSDGR